MGGCSMTCTTDGKVITQTKIQVRLAPSCKTDVLATLSSYFIPGNKNRFNSHGRFRNRKKGNNRSGGGGGGGRNRHNRGRGGHGRGQGRYQGKRRNRQEITGQPKGPSKEELDNEMDAWRAPKIQEPVEESMTTQE